jgi:outer membrane biosynthesis protein TonB
MGSAGLAPALLTASLASALAPAAFAYEVPADQTGVTSVVVPGPAAPAQPAAPPRPVAPPGPAATPPAPPPSAVPPRQMTEPEPTEAIEPPAPAPQAEPQPAAEPEPSTTLARNESTVFQVVRQVQHGCQTHCHGTRQTQGATQRSEVSQSATAVGTETSTAVNRSRTIQFVWQEQLGCVAFCFDTTQSQAASQESLVTQAATAIADAVANALNLAETTQFVWQYQRRCEVECHGTSSTQSINQRSTITQTATGFDGPDTFLGWLSTFAENVGATIETILQEQKADCLEHCFGDVLVQEAIQDAAVSQTADAGPRPPDVAEPPADGTAPPPVSEQTSAGQEQLVPGPPDAAEAPPSTVTIAGHARATSGSRDAGRRYGPSPDFGHRRNDPAARTKRPASSLVAGRSEPSSAATLPPAPAATPEAAAAQDTPPAMSAERPAAPPTAPTITPPEPVGSDRVRPEESAAPSSMLRPIAGGLGALLLLTTLPVLRRLVRRPLPDASSP